MNDIYIYIYILCALAILSETEMNSNIVLLILAVSMTYLVMAECKLQRKNGGTTCARPALDVNETFYPDKAEYYEWDQLEIMLGHKESLGVKICYNGIWMCLNRNEFKFIPCV